MEIAFFLVTILLLVSGYPVALVLGGVSILFAFLGTLVGFDMTFSALPSRVFGIMTNEILVSVPVFIFMGIVLERSKIAEDLLVSFGRLFGRLPGGLGIAVTIVGALLAASTGIVGATVVTMGLLALPTMLKAGYDKSLATGSILASGTLGQIIPPSIVLIILGEQIGTAYQRAQLEMGIFAPQAVSVGDLFAGALIPGLLLVGSYIIYQIIVVWRKPQLAPRVDADDVGEASVMAAVIAIAPALILIILVLGSILAGLATPTESASIGCIGAIMLAGFRLTKSKLARTAMVLSAICFPLLLLMRSVLDLRVTRSELSGMDQLAIGAAGLVSVLSLVGVAIGLTLLLRKGWLGDMVRSAAQTTSLIFLIVIGATFFGLVFKQLGGEETVADILFNLPGGVYTALAVVMLLVFFLGFFLEFVEIVVIIVPIVAPILLQLELAPGVPVSPIWLGILFAVNLQTSFLTPPFGFALFYLRGVAPPEVTTMDLYRGVVPFVLIQVTVLVLLIAFPALTTWLPNLLYN